jgi:hypothetical protein
MMTAEQFWEQWQRSENITHHTIDDWPIRLLEAYAAAQLADKNAKIAKLCEEFEAQRQARLAAENLVALTREEQAIITKLRTGKRLVTCNAVDRPHSFNLCNATEGHSFPKLLDEAELAEKEREIARVIEERRLVLNKFATLEQRLQEAQAHVELLQESWKKTVADKILLTERLRQREAELEHAVMCMDRSCKRCNTILIGERSTS